MTYTPEQLNKLPKWAQLEIKRLERDAESLNQKLKQISGELETNVFISDYPMETPLPKNAHIAFHPAKHQRVTFYIREEGLVDVNFNGYGRMAILPRASNSFYLTFSEK